MIKHRYYIDRRIGCIAVCDAVEAKRIIEEEFNGMHTPALCLESSHVIKLWNAIRKSHICSECHQNVDDGWAFPENVFEEAQQLCDKLNQEHSQHVHRFGPLCCDSQPDPVCVCGRTSEGICPRCGQDVNYPRP